MKARSRCGIAEVALPREVGEAIDWKVLLDSGEATEAEHQSHANWLRKSAANEAAWFDLVSSLSPFGAARRLPIRRGSFAEATMKRIVSRRKTLLGLTGVAVAGAAAVALSDRFVPLGDLTADRLTATGELETVALADGSDIVLGARTAIDLDFGADRRLITLREGEAMLRGKPGAVPLTARAGILTLQADEGTYVLRRRNARTSVVAVDRPARVTAAGNQIIDLAPGEAVIAEGDRISRKAAEMKRETAWIDGLLVVDDHDLASVVAALRPYYAGVIRLDPSVAALRVTGVFPLTDPRKALDLIARTLSLKVSDRTPLWISIGPQDPGVTPA